MPREAVPGIRQPCSGAAAVFSVAALAALAAACHGGGHSSAQNAFPPVNPPPSSSGWSAGTFLPSPTYAGQCAAPRSGVDPATGQPYPDLPGSSVTENNWLRSWSHELYLWYAEVPDLDPGLYATADYFPLLKTAATTPSGRPKDRFHFTYPTDQWEELSQSGVAPGYGVEWIIGSAVPPRVATVAYREPNSPAEQAGLDRGARLLSVDGVDFVNDYTNAGVDAINAAVYPAAAGETHSFEVLDSGAAVPRSFTMRSDNVTSVPVPIVQTIATSSGTVGYLLFNDHLALAEQALVDAVTTLRNANVDDLVLDIRYNGGGYLVVASELSFMIAGSVPTAGRTFEQTQFSDKYPNTDPVTGGPLTPLPFVSTTVGLSAPPGQPLPTLDLPRVFVLTGPGTCSASESIINSLRGVDIEVIQIGSTTCGKPYGFYPQDNCGTTYFTVEFRGVNAKGFGDYTDGFSPMNAPGPAGVALPGCSVLDDLDHGLGDSAEARLAAALAFRETGTCPAASGLGGLGASKPGATAGVDGRILKAPWRENRILTPWH
jgi:carboxyl-terminal processing protease